MVVMYTVLSIHHFKGHVRSALYNLISALPNSNYVWAISQSYLRTIVAVDSLSNSASFALHLRDVASRS